MKNRWPEIPLGEIASIGAGNSAPQDKSLFLDGRFPFYRTSDVGKIRFGEISNSADLLNERGTENLRRCPSGTILFPKSGASTFLNHRVMVAKPGYVSSHLATVKADTSKVGDRFLLYYLSIIKAQDLIQDHKYPSLKLGDIKKISIPLPPLPEQKRIVATLDEAFSGINDAITDAKNCRRHSIALFESSLENIFSNRTWTTSLLGDVASFKNGLNFTKRSRGQTVKLVGVGDFQDRSLVPLSALQSATIDGDISNEYLIQVNDILTVRSNGSKNLVGRCMLVPHVSEKVSFSGFIIRVRFDSKQINPCFLLHFLRSRSTRNRLTRDGGGANISNINQGKLSKLPIPLPPPPLQEKIAKNIDALNGQAHQLTSLYNKKVTALEELKRSLLANAFRQAS